MKKPATGIMVALAFAAGVVGVDQVLEVAIAQPASEWRPQGFYRVAADA